MVGTRRALLVAAPALALSACGKAADEPQQENPNVDTGTQKQGDIDLLRSMIEAEPTVGGSASGAARPVARQMTRDADDHRQALSQAIAALGGKPPVTAGDATDEPFDPDALLVAVTRSVALYLDFVPKLSDGRVRKLAAGILADKAGTQAQLRTLLDRPPVPEAFVS